MTHMSLEDFRALGAPDVVYIRSVRAAEVFDKDNLAKQPFSPDDMLFAVHDAAGERLAVLIDRESAFAAAMAHDLEPLSVH